MTLGPFRIPRIFAKNRACLELREHASDFLELDLSDEERQHILKHLEDCKDCQSFVDTLRETISMLGSLPRSSMPGELKQRLLHVAEAEKQQEE
tara:strand:- start:72 stop:353 length:282 start_codon:yes stop_codon:yes gene_type:complete